MRLPMHDGKLIMGMEANHYGLASKYYFLHLDELGMVEVSAWDYKQAIAAVNAYDEDFRLQVAKYKQALINEVIAIDS